MELLLEFQANVESVNNDAVTPLLAAAITGEVECLKALCNQRANLDHTENGENGNTALMIAASNGHVACVRLLLGLKADPVKTNRKGLSALQLTQCSMQANVLGLENFGVFEIQNDQKSICTFSEKITLEPVQEKKNRRAKRLEVMDENYTKIIQDLQSTADAIVKDPENKDLFANTRTRVTRGT